VTRRAALGILALSALPGCRRRSRDRDASGPDIPAPAVVGPPLPDREPIIRVRIRRRRGNAAPLRIGAAGQWVRVERGGHEGVEAVLSGPVEVSVTGAGWLVVDDRGFRPGVEGFEVLRLAPLDEPGPPLAVEDDPYPGALRLVPRTDEGADAFDVVNDVPLESYLPGVLAGELFSHWHLETYAALAIAARSFACTEHVHFRDRRHFDVTNTAASQVYRGLVDRPRAVQAARLTVGELLTYRGGVVPGYYSSCCGGTAATALDAIGPNPINGLPPLRGRPSDDVCADAPVFRWSVTRRAVDMRRRLRRYGRDRGHEALAGLGRLVAVDVVETNAHGRPRRYRLVGDGGATAELSAHALREAADYTGRGDTAPKRPLWSGHLAVGVREDEVLIDGRGFGHGVGLCQYGAERLARDGRYHREILHWYYPGVVVEQAYA
jgi:stage II sporulation protein D